MSFIDPFRKVNHQIITALSALLDGANELQF